MILEAYSSFGDAANSPFIVPVAAFVMVLGIVWAGAWSSARKRELESQERLAAIARGIVLPPTEAERAHTFAEGVISSQIQPGSGIVRRRGNVRLGGIVLLGVSAGLILFFIALAAVLQERDVLCGAAVGLITLGIGAGLLVDARIQSREIEDATLAESSTVSPTYPPRSVS